MEGQKYKEQINGVLTEYTIVKIISEHKSHRGVPKGFKRVQAVIRAGRRTETRHIHIPR